MGSQTGKSKSLRVSEELRTVQLVFEILLTISSLDESGFCFNIAKNHHFRSVQSDIQSDARNDIFVTLQLRSVQDKPETVSAVFMGNEVL